MFKLDYVHEQEPITHDMKHHISQRVQFSQQINMDKDASCIFSLFFSDIERVHVLATSSLDCYFVALKGILADKVTFS